jgi:hypothetical protein
VSRCGQEAATTAGDADADAEAEALVDAESDGALDADAEVADPDGLVDGDDAVLLAAVDEHAVRSVAPSTRTLIRRRTRVATTRGYGVVTPP